MTKELYFYNGPVMEFDRVVSERWTGKTYAVSESKAKSNLAYQYKKHYGKLPSAKITLPGKVVKGGVNGHI